ncbi:MAG: YceI family protein [Saprospiraceae bacterium]|jgi:polyisoprenoid-binding protein YceI
MRTCLLFLLFALAFPASSLAQERYYTKSATIVFDADGPLDDIEKIHAKTTVATCVIDAGSGQMEWALSIRSFKFENALMEEHFNENYLESDKFPKAVFKGAISDPGRVRWKEDGAYPVKVQGKMTIHGVTRDISASGNILVRNKQITAVSEIEIGLADYDIKIPSVVGFKIAKTAKVSIEAKLEVLPDKK